MGHPCFQVDAPLAERVRTLATAISTTRSAAMPRRAARGRAGKDVAFCCGNCEAPVSELGTRRTVCCGECKRRLSVPTHVSVACRYCQRKHHLSRDELGCERLCAECSRPLNTMNIPLRPMHQHRCPRGTYRVRASRHNSAVGVLLLGSLALTLLLLVFSRM